MTVKKLKIENCLPGRGYGILQMIDWQYRVLRVKLFVSISRSGAFLGIVCLHALVDHIEGRYNVGTLAPIIRDRGGGGSRDMPFSERSVLWVS